MPQIVLLLLNLFWWYQVPHPNKNVQIIAIHFHLANWTAWHCLFWSFTDSYTSVSQPGLHWTIGFLGSSIQLFFWGKSSAKRHWRDVTLCAVWKNRTWVSYFPPLFRLTMHSPSLQKASCSNPRPTFSNCVQSDVTSVLFCLMTFCKKNNILLRGFRIFQRKCLCWILNINGCFACFLLVEIIFFDVLTSFVVT